MNQTLRERIQAIGKTTASAEVKALCESLLSKKVISEADAQKVLQHSLTNKINEAAQTLAEAQNASSKAAAAAMMKNWNGPNKVSHVGDIKREANVQSEGIREISEQLIGLGGSEAMSAAKALQSGIYGVHEGVEELLSAPVSQKFPEAKYTLIRFRKALDEGASEASMVRNFVSSLNPFNWDKDVARVLEGVQSKVTENGVKLNVQNTIDKVKSSDKKNFFSTAIGVMSGFVVNESANTQALIRDLRPWAFNQHIKDLLSGLALSENEKGSIHHTGVASSAQEVFSPVHFAKGVKVFKAGHNYFGCTDDTMFRLSQEQINALPTEFHQVAEALGRPYVSINADQEIVVKVGDAKARITSGRLFVNSVEVKKDNFATSLSVAGRNTLHRTNEALSTAILLAEHADEVYNIDFAKHVSSSLYEGVECFVFRVGDSIFMNKLNPAMKEDKFILATGPAAVKLLREGYGFDLAPSVQDILGDTDRRRRDVEVSISDAAKAVQILETNFDKVARALHEVGDEPELREAMTLVEAKLIEARGEWNRLVEEQEEIDAIVEEPMPEPEDLDGVDFNVDVKKVGPDKFELTVTKGDGTLPGEDGGEGSVDVPVDGDVPADLDNLDALPPIDGEPGDLPEPKDFGGDDSEDKPKKNKHKKKDSDEGEEEDEPKGEDEDGDKPEKKKKKHKKDEDGFKAEFNESVDLGVNSRVKLKGGDRTGEVTGESHGTLTVTWDDGGSSDHMADDLDNLEVDIEGAANDNFDAEPEEGEQSQAPQAEGDETSALYDQYYNEYLEQYEGDEEDGDAVHALADEYAKKKLQDDHGIVYESDFDTGVVASDPINPDAAEMGAIAQEETPLMDETNYVKAKLTQDFGPYKAGDEVDVSAVDMTAAGDEDPISVSGGGEPITKKFLELSDIAPADAPADIKSRLDAAMAELTAIQQLADEGGMTIDINGALDSIQTVITTLDATGGEGMPVPGMDTPTDVIPTDMPPAIPADAEVNITVVDDNGQPLAQPESEPQEDVEGEEDEEPNSGDDEPEEAEEQEA